MVCSRTVGFEELQSFACVLNGRRLLRLCIHDGVHVESGMLLFGGSVVKASLGPVQRGSLVFRTACKQSMSAVAKNIEESMNIPGQITCDEVLDDVLVEGMVDEKPLDHRVRLVSSTQCSDGSDLPDVDELHETATTFLPLLLPDFDLLLTSSALRIQALSLFMGQLLHQGWQRFVLGLNVGEGFQQFVTETKRVELGFDVDVFLISVMRFGFGCVRPPE